MAIVDVGMVVRFGRLTIRHDSGNHSFLWRL